jgi:SagB-type dehydrogenase family enzyme
VELINAINGGTNMTSESEIEQGAGATGEGLVVLPAPDFEGQIALGKALSARRSLREFKAGAVSLAEVSQLLWAAQGVTSDKGHRTTPSAGALYPLELYLLAGNVEGLEQGVYHYQPKEHAILRIAKDDLRLELAKAAISQDWMAHAPLILVITAIYERTNAKYGDRTIRYVNMEVGAASQNVALQGEALGLGTVMVGAFYEMKVQSLLELPEDMIPLCLLPVGKK